MMRVLVILLVALPLVFGVRWLSQAFEVATGYSAKQLCSGVFVAGLPEAFIIENDIHVSMETLGPLLPQLGLSVDRAAGRAEASLLGTRAAAVLTGDAGCVLNPAESAAGVKASGISNSATPLPPTVAAPPGLAAVIEEAFAEPDEGQRLTLAVLVMHAGELVAERYADAVSPYTPLQGWSMNKSLMATWVGMQVRAGALALERPLAPLVAQDAPALAQSLDPSLNMGHLLHMESGLDFEETYLPGDDATRMLYRSPAAWRVAPGNGHRYPPGQHFSYSSGDTNLASWVWQQSLDRPYTEWLQQRFIEALGLSRMTSEHDASGVQVGSSFTYMTARDWARVGQFWLSAWREGSALLPDGWMREAAAPRPAAVHGNYGRGFWLNAQGRDFPNLPRNLFYASGHNGQFVVVFPDEDVVVVRLGLSSGNAATGLTPLLEGVLANLPARGRIAVAQPSGR